MTTETYFTPREAAAYLRSSTSTLAKARMTKRGPTFVRIGRAIRYRQRDIDAWMSSSIRPHVKQPSHEPVSPASESNP
jgi:excisionase family DNA binding protein